MPNEMLITQRVENVTLSDRRTLVSGPLQVAYDADLDTLLPRLEAVMANVCRGCCAIRRRRRNCCRLRRRRPEPDASVLDRRPGNGQGAVRSAGLREVLATLRELGVEIPFPSARRYLGAAPARSTTRRWPPRPPESPTGRRPIEADSAAGGRSDNARPASIGIRAGGLAPRETTTGPPKRACSVRMPPACYCRHTGALRRPGRCRSVARASSTRSCAAARRPRRACRAP